MVRRKFPCRKGERLDQFLVPKFPVSKFPAAKFIAMKIFAAKMSWDKIFGCVICQFATNPNTNICKIVENLIIIIESKRFYHFLQNFMFFKEKLVISFENLKTFPKNNIFRKKFIKMNFSPISSEISETPSKSIILDHKLAITKQSYLQIFEFPRSFLSRAKNTRFIDLVKTDILVKRSLQ